MRGRQLFSALLTAILVFASVAELRGQGRGRRGRSQNPEPAKQTFVERIEVRVVNLEAVVVDKNGQRVSGLGPDDFVLKVDGKKVPVGYFSEVEDGVAVKAELEPLETPQPAQPAGVSPGKPVGTSYLVFIDSYFTSQTGRRNRILDEIEENLLKLGPEDRMAIVAFGGRKLKVLSSWSRSEFRLAAAFDEARALPARGFATGAQTRTLDAESLREAAIIQAAEAQNAVGGPDAQVPTSMVREDGLPTDICDSIRRLESQVRREVMAVTAALRSFAKPPGRKVMVALSGGWPNSAKDYLTGGGPFTASECKQEGPKIYSPIYDTANRLGYTLYPVDVPDPKGIGVNAANASSTAGLAGGTAFARQYEHQATLMRVAEETGGQAMLGNASLSAFDRIVADTRSYYWLGFTPAWKGNDKEHNIKLEVTRPGLKVRSRQGFLDFSRDTEVSYVTESALLFGDLPGAIELGLEFGELPTKGKRRLNVPVELKIPLDQVAMLPIGDRYVAELELRIAVLDQQGNRNEMPVIPVTLEGSEAPAPGEYAIYETAIKLRSQQHDLVISIYDPLTDTVMAGTGSIGPAGGTAKTSPR